MFHDRTPLTYVPRKIRALGYAPPTYPQVYRAALNGSIPAEQVVTNRWSVRDVDLPKVITALGLKRVSSPKGVAV